MNTTTNTIDIPSADILHLLQAELVASGLHATSAALRLETGGSVGLPGLFPSSKGLLISSATEGRWGKVLELLDSLDLARARRGFIEDYHHAGTGEEEGGEDGAAAGDGAALVTPLETAVALAHEMTILELAEQKEVELAYATLRMCASLLDRALPASDDHIDGDGLVPMDRRNSSLDTAVGALSSRSGDVERRVTALSSLLSSASAADRAAGAAPLPAHYYGPSNPTRQRRREQVAKLFKRHVPEIPPHRLAALLQQSVKWQCHTGAFPTVKRLFHPPGEDAEGADEHAPLGGEEEDGDEGGKKKKKKKKKKKEINAEERFDLVLGNVAIAHGDGKKKRKKDDAGSVVERIPSRVHQTIRLGKKSYIETACFLPDGRGLVTGSSDGFVEVWGEPILPPASPAPKEGVVSASTGTGAPGLNALISPDIDFEKLRTSDLPYQRTDDLMMHEAAVLAMDVSRDGTLLGTTAADGTVCVWKIADGKLLRRMERAHGGSGGVSDQGAAVTCIQFSPDGSKLLTGGHDSTCREFGLLSSRMLKEFRGHTSYVNCCSYVSLPPAMAGIVGGGSTSNGSTHHHGDARFLAVVTASADGSVRIWDARTAEPVREITPPVPTSATAAIHGQESVVGAKSIHTVVPLHSPPHALVVVPRCDRAYLLSYSGAVLRTYARDDVQGTEFLAATVSASNQFLFVAADDGKCIVFDIATGKAEKIIRSFAEECSSGGDVRSGTSNKSCCDMSGLVCHPHRGFIGGYSNDRGQKRGILTLWK